MEARKLVSLPAGLAQAIEDFRFENRIGSESEAIRRLIEAGLSASKKRGPSSDGGAGGKSKPRATKPSSSPDKPNPPVRSSAPAAPLSKEAQLRALRENRA